ncbi:MAG TPA: hypothetical protein VH723_00840 [Candidatus Limnocylindrales bacterium]
MRTNPPTYVTIVVAILLMVVGLSLEGSLFSIAALNGVVADALRVIGIAASRDLGEVLIIVANALLILGSLIRGL